MPGSTIRACKKCGAERPVEDFPVYNPKTGKRRHECSTCNKQRVKSSHVANKDDRLRKMRERYRANPSKYWTPERRKRANELACSRTEILREVVVSHYGAECVACGEDEPLFLTLDHVGNDGKEWRKVHGTGQNLYRWIRKNGYPNVFQVLCMNCNWGKARNGGKLVRDRRNQERFNDHPERE